MIDTNGQNLSVESRSARIRQFALSLPNGLTKGEQRYADFRVRGAIQSGDDSPVQGLKVAYIGDPVLTYLLYAGRWFPMVGYGINRFTPAIISVSVPTGLQRDWQRQPECRAGSEAERRCWRGAQERRAGRAEPAGSSWRWPDGHGVLTNQAKLPRNHPQSPASMSRPRATRVA